MMRKMQKFPEPLSCVLTYSFPLHPKEGDPIYPSFTKVEVLGYNQERGMWRFRIKGKKKIHEIHYGWMFSLDHPYNLKRLKHALRIREQYFDLKKRMKTCFKQVHRLDQE